MGAMEKFCGTLNFSTIDDYYTYLWNKEWHKSKPGLPKYSKTFTESILMSDKKYRKSFVTTSVLLSTLLKNQLALSRKRKSNGEYVDDGKKQFQRIDIIPDFLRNSDCKPVKAAILMFCMPSGSPLDTALKRDVLLAQVTNNLLDHTTESLIRRAIESPKELRDMLTVMNDKCILEKRQKKMLIQPCLEVSDIVKDRTYAKLAFAIETNICCMMLLDRIEEFRNHYPFDALISRYIEICVARKDQKKQRNAIFNEFTVNRMATVHRIIESLLPVVSEQGQYDNNTRASHKTVLHFAPDQQYHVFVGSVDFPKHVMYSYRRYNNRTYFIGLYKDCIYDVIGDEDGLFSKLSWKDRLDKITGHTCVQLQEKTGQELNSFDQHATLGLSWFENDIYNYTTHTFKPKKQSSENGVCEKSIAHQEDDEMSENDDNEIGLVGTVEEEPVHLPLSRSNINTPTPLATELIDQDSRASSRMPSRAASPAAAAVSRKHSVSSNRTAPVITGSTTKRVKQY